jgi:hypothetical protein
MKNRFLLALALALGLCAPASAQVNTVPSPGLTTGYLPKSTYSSAFFGLAPLGAMTDFLCISGSATKTIRINRIVVGGTAVAQIALPVQIVRRVSLDTGGTAATTTANPGVTTQIASRDTGQNPNTAPTAVLISYTAVPTIVDSAPVYLDSALMELNTIALETNSIETIFDWSRDIENNAQVPTLRGASQQICVNAGGVNMGTPALNGSITWTEE